MESCQSSHISHNPTGASYMDIRTEHSHQFWRPVARSHGGHGHASDSGRTFCEGKSKKLKIPQAPNYKILREELEATKLRCQEIETQLAKMEKSNETEFIGPLRFKVDHYFAVGSPLPVFLALRGLKPKGYGSQEDLLPPSVCKRLHNVFHPADPIAYRLEPLILKHYQTIAPLKIHKYDERNPLPYDQMKSNLYGTGPPSTVIAQSTEHLPDIIENTDQSDKTKEPGRQSWFSKLGTRQKKDLKVLHQELQELDWRENQSSAESSPGERMTVELEDLRVINGLPPGSACRPTDYKYVNQTELEYRLDYELQERGLETQTSYIAALTSHTAYWQSADLVNYMLEQLFPDLAISSHPPNQAANKFDKT